MPNLPTHMGLAMQVASTLAHPTIDAHLGTFLLGSTSPDIRLLTKGKRDETHFAPLTIEYVGTGVAGLLERHPALADSAEVSDPTRVLLSGYFTHLVADETWILDFYRPYFDGSHLFADQVRANIWDRALQLEMDRETQQEMDGFELVRRHLDGSERGVGVEFIGPETLGRWRGWVTEFTTWEFTWDRLRFATHRMYGDDPGAKEGAKETVEEFLQSMPSSLEGVYNRIHQHRISDYREKVVTESVRTIKEYLHVPESD